MLDRERTAPAARVNRGFGRFGVRPILHGVQPEPGTASGCGYDARMAICRVPIELVHGDAREVPGDALVMGWTNPLKSWLADRAGHNFEPLDLTRLSAGLATADLIKLHGCPWRCAASIKCRISKPLGSRVHEDFSDLLAFLYRTMTVREYIIVPITWREPELVAFNTLLAVFVLAYYPDVTVRQKRFEGRVKIVALEGLEPYAELLKNGNRGFREKVRELEAILNARGGWQTDLNLGTVRFELTGP